MKSWGYGVSLAIGGSVPLVAMPIIGLLAAIPIDASERFIGVFSLLVTSIPFLFLAIFASALIVRFCEHAFRGLLIGYLSAIVAFILIIEPWKDYSSVLSGVFCYWEYYIYLSVLPAAGILINKKMHGDKRVI